LGEGEYVNLAACIWQFLLLALAFAALLVCGQSDRLPLRRVRIRGVAFIASIAYSAYLIQKLVIHGFGEFCQAYNIDPHSAFALVAVEICVYAAATILFFAVERPFLQLRKGIAPRRQLTTHKGEG
jgi:peptidoglycan/LPS O-acetylase OafA/YrhL